MEETPQNKCGFLLIITMIIIMIIFCLSATSSSGLIKVPA